MRETLPSCLVTPRQSGARRSRRQPAEAVRAPSSGRRPRRCRASRSCRRRGDRAGRGAPDRDRPRRRLRRRVPSLDVRQLVLRRSRGRRDEQRDRVPQRPRRDRAAERALRRVPPAQGRQPGRARGRRSSRRSPSNRSRSPFRPPRCSCIPFGVSTDAYASNEEFVAHAIAIERELIAEAVAAGCRYVQLDFPLYPYLVDPDWSARFEAAGHRPDELLERAIAADSRVLDGIPDGVTTGLHVCRGNYRSRWLCAGSLDPVAERLFGELPYDVFLVEWDDIGRDGGYGPIRFTPPGRVVVMGLVSSKRPELETGGRHRPPPGRGCRVPAARPAGRLHAVRLRLGDRGKRDRRGHAVAEARAGRPGRRPDVGLVTTAARRQRAAPRK